MTSMTWLDWLCFVGVLTTNAIALWRTLSLRRRLDVIAGDFATHHHMTDTGPTSEPQ